MSMNFDDLIKCPITDGVMLEITNVKYYSYKSEFYSQSYTFTFCKECFTKIPFNDIKAILRGHILNQKTPLLQDNILHWDKPKLPGGEYSLKELIDNGTYPRTPKEKLDNLFINIYESQKFDGERLFRILVRKNWESLYFKSIEECDLYLDTLSEQELISLSGIGNSDLRITYKGLGYQISITQEGTNSRLCFIAMAFDDETKSIREAVKSALKRTNYTPIIIDEEHIDSDKTINDAIIAGLRKCKFCVADFTLHRNGVYFESGFAVGQGKQVIYTCRDDEFKKAHFDIKPLQHIIYSTPKELEKLLIDKIEAWIH